MKTRREPQRPPWDHSPNWCCKPKKVWDDGGWNWVCNGPTPGRVEEDAAQAPESPGSGGCTVQEAELGTSATCPGLPSCWRSSPASQVRTPQSSQPLAPFPCPALSRVFMFFRVPRLWPSASAGPATFCVLVPWNHNPSGLHAEQGP